MALFNNLEIVEGWIPGSPQVLYKPEITQTLGEPVVDYDNLGRLFTDKLKVPQGFDVEIALHGTRGVALDLIYGHALGSYTPLRPHRIWVNAIKADRQADPRMRTMGVVAHEGKHLSDRANTPFRMLAEIALGAKGKYEDRARSQQDQSSLEEHLNDISFPLARAV